MALLAPPPKPPLGSPQWAWDQYLWLLNLYETQGAANPSGARLDRAERYIRSLMARPQDVSGGGATTFTGLTDTPGSIVNGDVYYGNSNAVQRLAKGTDGEVLTLASGLPSWAAGGVGVWTESNSDTISADDVTFELFPSGETPSDYAWVWIQVRGMVSSSNGDRPTMQWRESGGSFITANYQWHIGGLYSNNSTIFKIRTTSAGRVALHRTISNQSDDGANVNLLIPDPGGTTFRKQVQIDGTAIMADGPVLRTWGAGMNDSTAAIDAVRFAVNTGTISAASLRCLLSPK